MSLLLSREASGQSLYKGGPLVTDSAALHLRLNQLYQEFYEFAEARKSRGLDCPRGIPERYVSGEVALHLHIGVRPSDSVSQVKYGCAVFERASSVEAKDRLMRPRDIAGSDIEPNGALLKRGERRMDKAVLVGVREQGEDPERPELRLVPSVVRLVLLDDLPCMAIQRDSAQGALSLPSRHLDSTKELVPVREDGVEVVPSRSLPGSKHELPNEVIERGAEVVGDVPDDYPPAWSRVFGNGHLDPEPAGLRIELTDSATRLRVPEGIDLLIEFVRVLDRPLDLLSASVE